MKYLILIFDIEIIMDGKLQKPTFVKVSSLENSRDGYNVYVRVVSAEHETSQNKTFDMVRAVVAD